VLLKKGRPAPSEPWRILEVAIGQSPDVVAIRLAKELKRIHEKAIEALVPFKRNADGEPEWIIEHVYIRGANGSLGLLARTAGIDSIRKEYAPDDWIDQLLSQETPKVKPLRVGNFVRVLTGICARMCGNIEKLEDGRVTVAIELRTKTIRLHTYPENLQQVSCPVSERTFFYRASF
jgi:hypothetical protein